MSYLQTKAVKTPNQLQRRGSSANNDADGMLEFPAAGIFLQGFQRSNPDGGNAARDGYALADHQVEDAFRVNVGARQNQASTKHRASIRKAPGVGMEHGS